MPANLTPSERLAEIRRLASTPDGAALLELLATPVPQASPAGWTPGESSLPRPGVLDLPEEVQAVPNAGAVAAQLDATGFNPTALNLLNGITGLVAQFRAALLLP